MPALEDDAREPAQDHLDPAFLVDAAAGAVHILHADAHPLDRPRELPELHPQLPADVRSVVGGQLDSDHADVRGNP